MVNSGYTPRHSAAAALKVARRQPRAAEPAAEREERQFGVSRVQVVIISATALALLAIVTYFATRAEPSPVQATCAETSCGNASAGRPAAGVPAGPPAVRVYRGSAYALHGPSAVLA